MPEKKDLILELARKKGAKGLTGKEIQTALGMSEGAVRELCENLEEQGRLRVLVFSPMLLMEKSALDKIENSFFSLIHREQEKPESSQGVRKEQIIQKSSLPHRVIEWVLRRMIRSGKIHEERGSLYAVTQEPELSTREKSILSIMEKMCEGGIFREQNMAEIQKRLQVPTEIFDRLLEALLKKKKVIHSRDGILFHSQWLDDIIIDLKKTGKKTFTVSEFKEKTGLTRKFAIPLLELLDQTGITRKEGSGRIIL